MVSSSFRVLLFIEFRKDLSALTFPEEMYSCTVSGDSFIGLRADWDCEGLIFVADLDITGGVAEDLPKSKPLREVLVPQFSVWEGVTVDTAAGAEARRSALPPRFFEGDANCVSRFHMWVGGLFNSLTKAAF